MKKKSKPRKPKDLKGFKSGFFAQFKKHEEGPYVIINVYSLGFRIDGVVMDDEIIKLSTWLNKVVEYLDAKRKI